jgi:hypothetical protein
MKLAAIAMMLGLPVALVSGCADFVPPRWDASELRLVAVPFRDSTADRNQRWYGESERGRALVRHFRLWAEENGVGRFVVGTDEERISRAVANWLEPRIRPEDWRRILTGVDADVVLLGEIVEFRLRQPNDVNIFRGTAKMQYQLVAVRTGKTVYNTPTPRDVEYPEPGKVRAPFMEFDPDNAKKVEFGLAQALGALLGKDLYGYYRE